MITGTKGFGKSLLLIAKRKKIKGIQFIPDLQLVDTPLLEQREIDSLSKDVKPLLSDNRDNEFLWTFSIYLSIIKKLNLSGDLPENDISDSLKTLLKKNCFTPSEIFTVILKTVRRKAIFRDFHDDITYIRPLISNIKSTVAIFIDNVDECFEDSDRKIWYSTQIGLFKAIYEIAKYNPAHIKVFGTIRKEAYLKLIEKTDMALQYKGSTLDLSYREDELKQMFIKNIHMDSSEILADSRNQLEFINQFIGIDQIPHHSVEGEYEDTFKFIYRHTLRRPRDIMLIGGEIARCPLNERNPETDEGKENIKNIVYRSSIQIAEEYINEIATLTELDFNKVIKYLKSNVISQSDAKLICSKYNYQKEKACEETGCDNCKQMVHVFCELYKFGLIGIIRPRNLPRKPYVQDFLDVGNMTFAKPHIIPESPYYLLHPILTAKIRGPFFSNEALEINEVNIVGYDMPWKLLPKPPETGNEETKNPTEEFKNPKPQLQLDVSTQRLKIDSDRYIEPNPTQFALLLYLVEKMGGERYVLTYEIARKIISKVEGKNLDDLTKNDVQQKVASIRKLTRKNNITDKNALIKSVHNIGYKAGTCWHRNRSILGKAQVSTYYTDDIELVNAYTIFKNKNAKKTIEKNN